MWFEDLMGFEEQSPDNVRNKISIIGNKLLSLVNNESYQFGRLEIPTLKELKQQAQKVGNKGVMSINEIVSDVQDLHSKPSNRNALFQAASQFNLLEMVGPHISPERGVGIYEHDYTQGPACAIACGAGTIYRNYFASVNNQIGQSSSNQINCLELIEKELGNDKEALWSMRNGYALASRGGIAKINAQLNNVCQSQREQLKEKLKIGIQWDTEVTIGESNHLVSQAYCSALPVAYSDIAFVYWESFARLILEASYEATLYAALINHGRTGCPKVFLTLVGGDAFGNKAEWILDALELSVSKFKNTPLKINIVSYGASNHELVALINKLNG